MQASWFTSEVEYKGVATLPLRNADATLSAQVRVTLASDGNPEIEVYPAGDDALWEDALGIVGDGLIRAPRGKAFESLAVVTPEGRFGFTDRPYIRDVEMQVGGSDPGFRSIRLGALRSVFETTAASTPKYWVIPLSNFVSEMDHRLFPELASHPLWLPANPKKSASDLVDRSRRVVAFLFDGRPAFIQRVSEYAERAHSLLNGTCRNTVTALMVGEVGSHQCDFPRTAPETWFPMHLLSLLAFATGSKVGAPWFELRDADGQLIRRLHMHFGCPSFNSGFRAIDERLSAGATGHLLTCALQSPAFGQAHLHLALQRLLESATDGASLETRKVGLCRAFECLCKHFGCGSVDLSASLSGSQHAGIQMTLQRAAAEVDAIRMSATDAKQLRDLERISQRIQSAAQRENSFGHSVVQLAEMFDFPDGEILEHFFKSRSTTWAGALSRLRGAAMHEGYFEFAAGTYSVTDTSALIDHLHDLLTRIVLKIIGYEGPYRSLTTSSAPMKRDWVRRGADPRTLGFGVDRSM